MTESSMKQDKIYNFSKKEMEKLQSRDISHDFTHVIRVLNHSIAISEDESLTKEEKDMLEIAFYYTI